MGKMRKRVLDRSFDVNLGDIFDGRQISDIIAELQALDSKVDYGRGNDAKFRVEYGYEYTSVYMDVFRDETQKEFDARMLREERAKEKARKARETKLEKARKQLYQKEADERAEYERLKETFGV